MNTIRNVMEEVCYNHMDLEELELKRDSAVALNKNKYYKEELEKLNYIEEEQKVPIEANEAIEQEEVNKIDDLVVNEQLIKNMFRY
jgi:hypothetical protein